MKIQSAGRLGNILFIWAFALYFAKQSDKKVLVFIDKFHSDINQEVLETVDLLKIVDWISYILHKKSISSYLGVSFEDELNFTGKPIVRGFFQDTKYVSNNFPLIIGKLQEALQLVSSSSTIVGSLSAEFPNYQVVHIRLGDFIDSSNGVIDPASFADHIDANLPLIVCTNGSIKEVQLVTRFRIDRIITTDETTAWETLAIINNSVRFIGVNSTLSWWGALITSASNKPAYLPRQWKSYSPNRQSNLSSWPGINLYEATFTHPQFL